MLFRIVKFIIYMVDFLFTACITLTVAFLPQRLRKIFMPKLFRAFCWSFIRLLGRKPHIHEKFSPPLPKQYILIANHPSGYDLLVLNALFEVCPLAQSGVRDWFVLGKIAEAAGTVFVVREKKSSRNAAKKACIEAAEERKNLLIYPEGGCGRELRPFKYGAFDISIHTGLPIVPVYLQYEAENSYIWGNFGLIRHILRLFGAINKHTHCYIFDPIYPDSFADSKTFSEYTHRIYENLEQLYRLPILPSAVPTTSEIMR